MFKGFSNLANLPGLIRQAQEMGAKMQALNKELESQRVTGAAGGGLVSVEANGLGQVLTCRIDPSLTDREMLEDLLPAAINLAQAKAKELHMAAMQNAAGGMDMSGMQDLMSQIGGPGT